MKKFIALVLCLMFCVASVGVAESDQLVVATVVKAIGSNWFDSMDWEGTRWAEEPSCRAWTTPSRFSLTS